MRGRCPAGQRGVLSRQLFNHFTAAHWKQVRAGTNLPTSRSFAPPSGLPAISPARGEISSFAASQAISLPPHKHPP
ncbi:hypothetical protein MESS2_90015 [Mesorhizobium metallidurans STM 2683]|uniref:Uncharacterized protein n=1 Tax=Mesorhizobium metallidurans STM 2683 TaxID=1297569 RepID=M5EZ22_9HYPH|nr:hypothetical protein MESS2_90015 [Mesorhizobium metallidurans STM 2683]